MNRLLRPLLVLIALTAALATAGIVRADDLTLDVSGILTALNAPGTCSPSGCALGGDVVINTTTGAVVSADVTMSGESPSVGPFSTFLSVIASVDGTTRLAFSDSSSDYMDLFFVTPTQGSLVGYDGGALDTLTGAGVPGGAPPTWLLTSGAFTPVGTAPDPSAVILLLAGIAFVFVIRKPVSHGRPQPSTR